MLLSYALKILSRSAGGRPVAPHVAGRLAAYAADDESILRQLAGALSAEQLSGSTMLPDPLPVVDAETAGLVERLQTAERRLLLFIALAPDFPLPHVLDIAGLEPDALLLGSCRDLLQVEAGLAHFRSPQVRAHILTQATGAEISLARETLARAETRRKRPAAAMAQRFLANPVHSVDAAKVLVEAAALATAGRLIEAHELARRVVCLGGETEGRAWLLAARCALWAGAPGDARRAMTRAARLLPTSPLVADLGRLLDLIDLGPSAPLFTLEETALVYRTLAATARNVAERTLMEQLGAVFTAVYEDPDAADALHARVVLATATAADACWSPLAAAHLAVAQLTALVFAGQYAEAARLLAASAPRFPLMLAGGGITADYAASCADRDLGIGSDLVRALRATGPRSALRFDEAEAAEMFAESTTALASSALALTERQAGMSADPVMSAPAPGAPLSGRQQDVLDLLLQGLSNREIGGQLDISHRTVEVHATQVLRKYRAPSRAALIAMHAGLDPHRS